MNTLNELVYLVGRNKIKGLDTKDLQLDQDTKMAQLYHQIADGNAVSNEAAIDLIYPDAGGTAAYRNLKRQLKKRLINYLFFIDLDLPAFTDRQRAFLECQKQWAAVRILFGRAARNAGVDLAAGLIKKAMHFEFNEIVMDVARILRSHYGGMIGDRKKYRKYKALYERYEKLCIQENRIESCYTEVVFGSFSKKTSKEELHASFLQAYDQVKPLLEQTPTYKAQLNGYLTIVMMYASRNDNESMIEACQRAIDFFESKPYQANTPLQIFYYQQLIGYTQLRQFDQGKRVAEKCLSFLEPGTFNWFKYFESYFILAMHTGQYDEAFTIFGEVTGHCRFQAMPGSMKEIWKIYEAYLYVILSNQKSPSEGSCNATISKFRIGRFLNEVPIYSKEKQGMNIAILVIQILLYIQKKQHGKAIDRMEAIEKYCTRYLKTKDTLRSYYFIKMLLTIPAKGFHRTAVLRHTRILETKLRKLPLELVDQDHKVEVIPYEQLWSISIGLLEQKIRSLRTGSRIFADVSLSTSAIG